MKVALVTVVSGERYERFSDDLYETAKEHFQPGCPWSFIAFPGVEGWPAATLQRYDVVRNNWGHLASFSHIFLIDADMRMEATVGPEILGEFGTTATLHPGYVGKPVEELPYERRHLSNAYIRAGLGEFYYCGGFIGGRARAFKQLCNRIRYAVREDDRKEIVAVWHDESHLNRVLAYHPPEITLSPAYCHPDQDEFYRSIWPMDYPRVIVALDKTAEERGDR